MRADMAVDMAGLKTHRHVAMYAHSTWHTRLCGCMHVCTHVCACVISEIAPSQDFCSLTNLVSLIYLSVYCYFCHVRLFVFIFKRM